MRGGNYQIRDLLARYKNLTPPQGTVVEVFVRAVKEGCGITLEAKSIRYTVGSRTIGLLFAGPRKTEIIFKAQKILLACREELGEKNAPRAIV